MKAVRGSTLELHLSGAFTNTNTGVVRVSGAGAFNVATNNNLFTNAGKLTATSGGSVEFTGGGKVVNTGTVMDNTGATIDFSGLTNVNNQGTITVDGQESVIKGKGILTGKAVMEENGGQLVASAYNQTGGYNQDNGLLEADEVTINGGMLFGTGTAQGHYTNGGILLPGDGTPNGGGLPTDLVAGTFTISGNYTQVGSGILHELLQQYDLYSKTHISESDDLGGTLDIDLARSLAVQLKVGDKFEIMDADSVSGEFSTVDGAYIGNGLSFEVLYDPAGLCKDGPTCVILEVEQSTSPAPEPGTLALFGSGFVCLSIFFRKRLHKTA
jgi:hypothetical protein